MKTITSRHHPFVARCRAAARGRSADAGEILLDGVHLIEEAVDAEIAVEIAAFTAATAQSTEGGLLAARLDAGGTRVLAVSDAVMEALSPVRTPAGVVAIGRHRSAPLDDVFAPPPALVVGIAGVQDPGNVGAIIRAAEAAGATGVVVTEASANPFGWKALRGAMGSAFRIPVASGVAVSLLLQAARAHGARRIATVPAGGVEMSVCDLTSAVLVLVGSEGHGLDADTIQAADERLHIAMATHVESLNVAVAAGVILFRGPAPADRSRRSAREMSHPTLYDDEPGPGPRGRTPLAERMRPKTFDEYVGQGDLLSPGKALREAIERDLLQSVILWGPPGTGKTSLARLVADTTQAHFMAFSAVLAGIKEIKEVMAEAQRARERLGRRTIVFVDEIHRFNKAQQDAFLPRVEAGDIVLIGATTENPSFEVNAPLLSRSQVFVLQPLTDDDIRVILTRALADCERGLGAEPVRVSDAALDTIARYANGDARVALNLIEFAAAAAPEVAGTRVVDDEFLRSSVARRALLYDRGGDEHYNLISALHKSMRNSDPDAAVYWLARMLEAGEDPLFIARRLVRFASEDIGNADPQALSVAVAAKEATHFIGMPEGNTALTQAAIYLATAPKSNAVYQAYQRAAHDAHRDRAEPVPLHLRNAPTALMKQLDYGRDYEYAHDDREGVTGMDCLPPSLAAAYTPSERGFEREIKRRLDGWAAIKRERRSSREHD